MYCSSCGATVSQSLTYCNQCGAILNSVKSNEVIKTSEVKPESLISAIAAVFIVGLVAIAILVGVMKQVAGFDLSIILAVILFSFLMMFLIEVSLIRLLFRHKKAEENVKHTNRLNEQVVKEFYSVPTKNLTEPIQSITEQTTNQLQPIYIESKPK